MGLRAAQRRRLPVRAPSEDQTVARARKKARAAMARSTPALPSISGKPRPVPVVASERLPVPVVLVDEEETPVWEDWLEMEDIEDWLDIVDIEDDAWAGAAAATGAWGAAE